MSGIVRVHLLDIYDFAEQSIRKIQRAPLSRTDIVIVVPIEPRMRVGVPDDVKSLVGVDARWDYGAILATDHGDVEMLPRSPESSHSIYIPACWCAHTLNDSVSRYCSLLPFDLCAPYWCVIRIGH